MKPDEMSAASSPVVSQHRAESITAILRPWDVANHSFTAPIRLLHAPMIVE
jgi:hypothetical protein